jgi:PEP-CTERM motif
MKRRLAATSLCALALLLGSGQASADHVFTLSGVEFDDQTFATGTFTTDNSLSNLLDFDIKTSNGTLTGFEYTPTTIVLNPTDLPFLIALDGPDQVIQLTFVNLTATGSLITIGSADSFESNLSTGGKREIVAGSVVSGSAVPEPSTLLMGGFAALTGLGLWTKRRRAH